jgi:hypothetical protein
MDYLKNQKPSNESLENLSLQMLLIKRLNLLTIHKLKPYPHYQLTKLTSYNM